MHDLFFGILQFYEYGLDNPPPERAVRYAAPPLGLQPPHELQTLDDYRLRHALYRQDPSLQVSFARKLKKIKMPIDVTMGEPRCCRFRLACVTQARVIESSTCITVGTLSHFNTYIV